MTRRAWRGVVVSMLVGMVASLAVVIAFRGLLRDPEVPADLTERIRWVTQHPADWRAASMVSEAVLDSSLSRRLELWRASFSLAEHVAPLRPNPRFGFVRAGLFHWYELTAADRRQVLAVAAPLMSDESIFERIHGSIWQVTRDMRWLRRVAPDSIGARASLQAIAIRFGLFDHYRALREELRRERLERLAAASPDTPAEALISLLPPVLSRADEPLVVRLLEALEQRMVDPAHIGHIEPLIEFAVRRQLKPLGGLRPVIETPGTVADPTRARAALEMGDRLLADRIEISTAIIGAPEWTQYYLDRARYEAKAGNAEGAEGYLTRAAAGGTTPAILAAAVDVALALRKTAEAAAYRRELTAAQQEPPAWNGTCGGELCNTARTTVYLADPDDTVTIALEVTQSDEVAPYVELYVDDHLHAERAVADRTSFEIRAGSPGLHRIELRLVNRLTKNGVQRRLRIS